MDSLKIGNECEGFLVVDAIPVPELSGTAFVMRHTQSGARTLWLSCDDNNKSFAIAFKTPPANDTGVFHILEHSVLCGSEKFPVKEPFVNLLKTSMQTFLNALTFADKTMYPVASTNTADLENLVDVYLDAVLHPAIYQRPRIFEQEGWHYEISDEGRLVYNGVVFNEMKGATSDPDDVLFLGIDRALFPNTPYRFESGGDPRAIPSLTYEEFLNNHRRHYALSNSYIVLYGNMDIQRELAFIDERLRTAAPQDAGSPNPLPIQEPVCAELSTVRMATAPENAAVALAYVVGSYADRERVLACDVLTDTLAGSNEAPLKRKVLEAGLADDFNAFLVDGELQPRIVFMLKGAKPNVAKEFRELVEGTCAELSKNGIGRDQLRASLAQAEFNLREQDFGSYPTGVALSVQVMSSWLYDDDRPIDYIRYEDAIQNMKQGVDQGYFEDLLSKVVCLSNHNAEVELVPTEDAANAEETEELAQRLGAMDEDEIAAVRAEVAALRLEQETPDDPQDLATLPQLKVADIEDAEAEPALLHVDAPLPCIAHEVETRHIDYVYHYFSLNHLTFEELPYVAVLNSLLGKLPTTTHSASELDTLVELNLGTLDFFAETHSRDNDLSVALPYLVVGASALSENVDKLATIPQEVWGHTLFEDTDRMLAILQQRRISLEQHFTNAGHAASMSRLSTQYAASAKVAAAMGGVDYYLFLKELLGSWDERKGDLVARIRELSQRVFTANNVLVSFTGSACDRDRFWRAAGRLGLADAQPTDARLVVPPLVSQNEAFIIPSNVNYVARGSAPSEQDVASYGNWCIANRVLSYDYLWNEVRVKGGAYGTGFRHTQNGLLQFWSYRDPGIDATLARYDEAAAWLKDWQPTDDELAGYIVSTVATHDTPQKPRALARRQDMLYLSGKPEGWRDDVRAQELATSVIDLKGLVPSLVDATNANTVVVFGSRETIEASSVEFSSVQELMS